MSRSAEGLTHTMERVRQIRDEFWQSVRIPGEASMLNPEVEKAGRVADFLEFAELMARDAFTRNESCGGHFREEYQTPEGEALRDDENFCHVTAWEYTDVNAEPVEHREPLTFDFVKLTQRSYK
ncbi:MAG: hypothetical protein ACK55I_09355 [bacterium]